MQDGKIIQNKAQQVRELVCVDQETRKLFGGPPYESDISRSINNFERYLKNDLPKRPRVNLGTYVTDSADRIIGFQATTLMQNAKPTAYELEYILTEGSTATKLNYGQLKKIVVHPDHKGTGVGESLLAKSIALARKHCDDWVVDVKEENERMLAFLKKNGILPRFLWRTPSDNYMIRLGT